MGTFDYFFTPADVVRATKLRHVIGLLVGGVLTAVLLKVLGVGLDVALFVGVITMIVIWQLDARIPFSIAILCFVLIMITSLFEPSTSRGTSTIGENLAVMAFYSLVGGVVLLLVDHFRNPVDEPLNGSLIYISPASRQSNNKNTSELKFSAYKPPHTTPKLLPKLPVTSPKPSSDRSQGRITPSAVERIRHTTKHPIAKTKPKSIDTKHPHGLDKNGLRDGKPIQL